MPHNKILNEEYHFMIADKNKSYVVEFINNEMKVIENAKIMTNFYLYNVIFNNDGSVYTPYTQTTDKNAIITNNITKFGSGLERYNLINSKKDSINDIDDMISLMQELYYTFSYTNSITENTWLTEFTNIDGLTIANKPSDFEDALNTAYQRYLNRDREKGLDTRQTVHTSVFDIENKKMKVIAQEGTEEYIYEF